MDGNKFIEKLFKLMDFQTTRSSVEKIIEKKIQMKINKISNIKMVNII